MSLSQEQLEQIRQAADRRVPDAVSLASEICEIPAPTGDEAKRARHVAGLLEARGYATEIDDISNVYAYRGLESPATLMLLAHTDTVFPHGTNLKVTSNAEEVHGPGIGDNCLGVAAMITAIDVLDDLGIGTEAGIRIVANVGEEGLGNLRGAWRAVERFKDSTGAVVAIEGHNLGRITNVGVGSKRWKVTVHGPGGHSWGAFGEPSAIHGLGRIIAGISRLEVPEEPRTTYNVGMIEGGTSINTIAPKASALIDMRSVDVASLDRLANQVADIIQNEPGEGLTTDVEILGERPAGSTSLDHPVIRTAAGTLTSLGLEPVFDASSTDANVPISMGIPAFCIGITLGGRVHTVDEYISTEHIGTGLAQLSQLCVDLTKLLSQPAS